VIDDFLAGSNSMELGRTQDTAIAHLTGIDSTRKLAGFRQQKDDIYKLNLKLIVASFLPCTIGVAKPEQMFKL